jgi:hypothetical protein
MGIDIGGNTIIQSAGGISLNTLAFNSAGQGSARSIPGYSGWKGTGNYYAAPSGWETDTAQWQSGLNLANGVFTCPVAGLYAMGYNGIHNGGSNIPSAASNTYGYAGFAKNGALSYYVHWNQETNTYWNTGGTSAVFSCAAGDTLALFVNRPPVNGVQSGYGLYPASHHCVWCKLIG